MALLPILAAAAPAVIQGIGGAVANRIAGPQRVPDLVAPAINSSQASLQDLEDQQRRTLALIEDQAARTGSQGTAAREDLLNANARQDAAVRGNILDTVARARQQQELIETDLANQQRAATIEGITGGAGLLGEAVGGLLNPVDTEAGTNFTQGLNTPELSFSPSIPVSDTLQPVQVGLTPGMQRASNLPSLEDQFRSNVFRFNQ